MCKAVGRIDLLDRPEDEGRRRTRIVNNTVSRGLALLLPFLFAVHTLSAQSVKTDYAKDYDFGALKRFAWKKNHLLTMRRPEDNNDLDRKIMRTVNQELAAKGIVEDSANPEFYLFYHAGPGDEGLQAGSAAPAGLDSIQPPDMSPPGSNMWNAGAGTNAGFAPSVWYSVQGKFVFYALDSKSKVVIWEGTATKTWHDPQKARKNEDKEIKQIVAKSFKDFPPKGRK
jgi:hypothetical protein